MLVAPRQARESESDVGGLALRIGFQCVQGVFAKALFTGLLFARCVASLPRPSIYPR